MRRYQVLGRETIIPRQQSAHRIDDFVHVLGFGHKAVGALLGRLGGVQTLLMPSENQHLDLLIHRLDPADHSQTVGARQKQIQHHEIGQMLLDLVQTILTIIGNIDHRQIAGFLKASLDCHNNNRVVVNYDDFLHVAILRQNYTVFPWRTMRHRRMVKLSASKSQ